MIESGGLWGLTMTLAPGVPFGEVIRDHPALAPRCLTAMAALHGRIHACPGDRLPDLRASLAQSIAVAPSLDLTGGVSSIGWPRCPTATGSATATSIQGTSSGRRTTP